MEEKKDKIKLLDYAPYLGSLIIFLGVCRLSVFYGSFNVNIVPFLEFSEILTSFLDLLVLFIVMAIYSIIQNFMMETKSSQETQQTRVQKLYEQTSFLKRLKFYFYVFSEMFFFVLIISVVFFVFKHFFNTEFTNKDYIRFLTLYLLLVGYLMLQYEIQIKHHFHHSSTRQRMVTSASMYLLLMVSIVWLFATYQADRIKVYKSTKGMTLLFTDAPNFVSTENDYYIGKTQKYVFVYHEKTKTTDVIPVERVKQMIFKTNKD